jgi:hypothetical protein
MNFCAKNPALRQAFSVTGKRRTTVQQSTFGLTMDEKMPTLRKIKRGVLPKHKPTQKHHI